jgi:hypothetical protein
MKLTSPEKTRLIGGGLLLVLLLSLGLVIQRHNREIVKIQGFLQSDFGPRLDARAKEIAEQNLAEFLAKLTTVKNQVVAEQEALDNLKVNLSRLERGLPELVDLESLANGYSEKIRRAKNPFHTVVTFFTRQGEISFNANEINIVRSPSRNTVAWIRIGKEKETRVLQATIKSWIAEALEAKIKNGHKKISEKTTPTAYGSVTENLLESDTMYFKTSYQYERVQGTYNSTSYQYSFFVETGSKERSKTYLLDQYTWGLGS